MSNHVSSEKVDYDWSNIEAPQYLAGWAVTGKNHEITEGPRARERWDWSYNKNDRGVAITIISYKIGTDTALIAIRNFVNKSNMVEPPYMKGPSDLGTISLVSSDPYGYEVHWAYRDLEFSVEATDKDLALKTAYWLSSIAQANRKQR